MNTRALAFRNNFLNAFRRSKFSSLRSLSLAAGISASRAQKIASGDFDNSINGPGIFLVDSICKQLNCTPNDLLGYETQSQENGPSVRSGEPTIERLISGYVFSGGHINGFMAYSNYCQIYDEPKNGAISLVSNGSLSLASRASGVTDVDFLQKSFFDFPEETRRKIFEGQRHAWENGIGIEVVHLDHNMPTKGRRARFDFFRAAFRIRMADDTDKLLVYCAIVEQQLANPKT